MTSTAKWAGSKLVIITHDGFSKHEVTYSFDEAGSGNLIVTNGTTLLHTRSGALTVSTIGPFTRVYKRD